MDSSGKITGVDGITIPVSRGIFLTWGLNPDLPHCRQIIYHLSHQGNPYALLLTQKNLMYMTFGNLLPSKQTGMHKYLITYDILMLKMLLPLLLLY